MTPRFLLQPAEIDFCLILLIEFVQVCGKGLISWIPHLYLYGSECVCICSSVCFYSMEFMGRYPPEFNTSVWVSFAGISLLSLLAFVFSFLSGFNVGRSAGGRSTVREINRDACHFPGFPVLQSLLPKHTNVPALYFLLMALFLQQPVTELPENLQVSAPIASGRCKQGSQVGIT